MISKTLFVAFLVCLLASLVEATRPSLSSRPSLNVVERRKDLKPTIVAAAKKAPAVVADQPEVSLNGIDLILCGAFATAIADVTMHPIDTIKVTQQGAAVALGALETAKKIFASGGIAGFYPGVWAYLIGDGIGNAIKLATFEISKVFLEKKLAPKFHPPLQFLCGAGAMVACSFILVPGEVIKTRLQTGIVSNMVQAVKDTLKQDGIGGLFAGYYATLIRDIPYTMLELGIYENMKTFLRKYRGKKELDSKDELAAAAIAGGFTAFVTTPLDLVKTRLMMQSTTAGGQYSGVADALLSVYNQGGISALFVGSFARVAWLLPFTTIYLGVYEVCKKKLIIYKKEQIVLKRNAAAAAVATKKK